MENGKIKLTEEELEIIYNVLNLDFSDMTEAAQDEWVRILSEIENNIEDDNKIL